MESSGSSIDSVSGASPHRRRGIVLLVVFLVLLLLAFIPPLVNVNRYQRRVARNIGAALGRPVHFDRIALNLLPFPGFTLDNFVVEEDPAFGSEPVLRASEVRASLRLRSLWDHRVEFSRISLTDPSVNLVHTADGRWNIESLLLQSSRTQAAHGSAGPAPRFPYIEASGARLNLKLDREKTPFSLTDADFALWLPAPHQWRLRIEAHPIRTDTDSADTGPFRIEATLGTPDAGAANTPATTLANLPIDLHGEWRDVQLGGLSRLLIARDTGLRGDLTLSIDLLGTLGHNAITAQIGIDNARRADFIPPSLLSIQAGCHAIARNTFHTFSNIQCDWPPSNSSDPRLLALTANFPDIRRLNTASAAITLPALPADTLLDWLGVATPRPPSGLSGPGILTGTLAWNADLSAGPLPSCSTGQSSAQPNPIALHATRSHRERPHPQPGPHPQPKWSGHIEFSHESLQLAASGSKPIPLGNLMLCSTPPPTAPSSPRRGPNRPPQPVTATGFDLLPIELPLGGKQPATLEGHFDASGYTLHLAGSALPAHLLTLGDDIPQFGDGLRQILAPPSSATSPKPVIQSAARGAQSNIPEDSHPSSALRPSQPQTLSHDPALSPIHLDLTATRAWGGAQSWHQSIPPPPHAK